MAATLIYLPFHPPKGKAYTLYFTTPLKATATTWDTIGGIAQMGISKDGGAVAIGANAPTLIDNGGNSEAVYGGKYSLVLTAAEMNADVIIVSFRDSSSDIEVQSWVIETSPSELIAIPDTNSTLVQKIQAIFQYLFYKRTVTADTETLYKEDGSTSLGTSSVSDNGTTFTKGIVS